MRKQTILVTGGAGFLGSHLCERLLTQSARVICLDNFETGSKENLRMLISNPNFSVIEHDICDSFSAEINALPVNAIFHLACPASPVHYQRDPIHTTKTSVLGALHVLELAKRRHIPVLYTSTSEIYGDPHEHPQREEYWGHVNSIGPRACYDEGKRCAESLFMDYHRQYEVDIRIARIFNTYGPQMSPNDGRVISNFIVNALRNEPLTIYGQGEQTRSFCYVDDMISGLICLMKKTIHTPINIGNPIEKNIKEIANQILALTKSTSPLSFHPLPIDDPKQRCPDISKAKQLLGWAPLVPFHIGLEKTIAYFQMRVTP